MAVTLPQAIEHFAKADNAMMVGIGKSVITLDQMSLVLPFMGVAGPGLSYEREGLLPTGGAFIGDDGVTSEESTGRPDYVHVPFRRIVGNSDTDALLNAFTDGQEEGSQLVRKVKATWRKVQTTNIVGNYVTGHTFAPNSGAGISLAVDAVDYGPWLGNRRGPGAIKYTHAGTLWQFRAPGDVDFGTAVACAADGTITLKSHNPSRWIKLTIDVSDITANDEVQIYFTSSTNEYEGLQEIVDPSMVITETNTTNGDAFDLAMLDALMEMVKTGNRSSLAFVMKGKMYNKVKAALRSLGGTTPDHVTVGGQNLPAYDGIPILRNDFIPDEAKTGNTASSIYLGAFTPDEGVFMGVANYGGETLSVDTDVTKKPVMGFQVDQLGALEDKDASRQRVKFYGALGLKSIYGLARRSGVIHATP